MKKNKLKLSLPTLRERKRYIKIKVISEKQVTYEELEHSILNALLDFFGEYGFSKLSFWIVKDLYDENTKTLVIKCNNKSVLNVIAGIGMVSFVGNSRVVLKILKISGTINKLN